MIGPYYSSAQTIWSLLCGTRGFNMSFWVWHPDFDVAHSLLFWSFFSSDVQFCSNLLMKVRFRPLQNLYQVNEGKKNWWSILETSTTSSIFNQFTSGLLHSVLHLMIYYFKRVYEFVCYVGNCLSQQRVLKIYFNYINILAMVRHIPILLDLSQKVYIA